MSEMMLAENRVLFANDLVEKLRQALVAISLEGSVG